MVQPLKGVSYLINFLFGMCELSCNKGQPRLWQFVQPFRIMRVEANFGVPPCDAARIVGAQQGKCDAARPCSAGSGEGSLILLIGFVWQHQQ